MAACIVFAANTLASLSTSYPSIIALAVFLLAMRLFADATLSSFSDWLAINLCFSLLNQFHMLFTVLTLKTRALRSAYFSWWKALAISLKATRFAAGTSSFLLLDYRSLNDDFLFVLFNLPDKRIDVIILILLIITTIQTSKRMVGDIFNGLD